MKMTAFWDIVHSLIEVDHVSEVVTASIIRDPNNGGSKDLWNFSLLL
jgi:hypothetical protein